MIHKGGYKMENLSQVYKVYRDEPETFIKIADILKALGHPQRLCIAKSLCESGPHSVTEMQHCLEEKQPIISKHLMSLKAANVISGERVGNKIFYSISDDKMKKLVQTIIDEFFY